MIAEMGEPALDIKQLLDAPGMAPLVELAPLLAITLWVLITALLWKDGFNDLLERFTEPRWSLAQRAGTLAMIPWRAVMLSAAAAIGGALTTLGLLLNLAVILNAVRAGRFLFAQ